MTNIVGGKDTGWECPNCGQDAPPLTTERDDRVFPEDF